MHPSAIICIALCVAASGARAHETAITVGNPRVDGGQLMPYENMWRYSVITPDGVAHVAGLWTDRLEAIDVNGRKALRRVEAIGTVNGHSTLSINVFDAKTMAPISGEAHAPDGSWTKRSFAGKHVTDVSAEKMDFAPVTQAVDMPVAVFDYYGGMTGLLLAALPLKTGMHGAFAAIDGSSLKYLPGEFTVTGEENLAAGKLGIVHTFVVETGGLTYWIAQKPPYVVKVVSKSATGTAVWEEP